MNMTFQCVRMTRLFAVITLVLLIGACSDEKEKPDQANTVANAVGMTKLTVYKTPACGCCGEWVDHVGQAGFKTDVVNQDSVAHIKDRFGIPRNARSCHTAITDEDLVFEGHVPAKYIREFLTERPSGARGLIVPAMPLGSPGMEYQDQFQPYTIFMMTQDGQLEPYAKVASYAQQFD